MKPFDIELAKKNHPIQTRDGRPARIICYNRKSRDYPIVCLITCKDIDHNNEQIELSYNYTLEGKTSIHGETCYDLFMAPIKKEGWINLYVNKMSISCSPVCYPTEEDALKHKREGYIKTIKIEWEE